MNEYILLDGLRKRHGSETKNSSIKDKMVLEDIEGTPVLVE